MKCPKCGMETDTAFCPVCGAQISSVSPASQNAAASAPAADASQNTVAPAPIYTIPPIQKKWYQKTWAIVLLLIFSGRLVFI